MTAIPASSGAFAPEGRPAGRLIPDMLARGIPLTLLLDLAWPDELARETAAPGDSDFVAGRHAC